MFNIIKRFYIRAPKTKATDDYKKVATKNASQERHLNNILYQIGFSLILKTYTLLILIADSIRKWT